jgi:hypothetical protein
MVTTTSGGKPKYFFSAFGEPHAKKHPVEGGIYPHRKGFVSSLGIVAGDVMLLYCCEYYLGHDKEAPGIGIVTGTQIGSEEETIYYQYFPLCHPVGWDTITACIPELKGNTNFSLAGNWLRAISSSSYRAAIAGRQIDWP